MSVDDFVRGYVMGLVEMNDRLLSGADNEGVRNACEATKITIDVARRAGVMESVLKKLERAGVK